jgi:FkbM family methyltransferase
VGFVKTAGWTPGTVIDVGACYGTPELLHGFPDAYHILFEPVAELEARMKVIMARFKGEYHMVALGAAEGVLPMAVPEGNVEGSTLAVRGGENVREVPIRTLDAVFEGRDLPGPILLKTDCQGYDLDVMKGGVGFLDRVDLVVMEVNMFHPAGKRELPDFGEIVGWMRDRGFSVYDIISYQVRPFDNALGYVDLVFVKTDGPFRKHHRWA